MRKTIYKIQHMFLTDIPQIWYYTHPANIHVWHKYTVYHKNIVPETDFDFILLNVL